MTEAMKKAGQVIKGAMYQKTWKPSGGDLVGAGSAGSATAFIIWVFSLFDIPIPAGAAAFLGSILGLVVARIFKP
jgi:hypothetical protein